MIRDPGPCSTFRPALPYLAADQLCRCGWPRTIWSHGQPPQRVVNRRPPSRGKGLDGPMCEERLTLDQGYRSIPPSQAMCFRCGRVTHRRDSDGLAWCGGEPP